MYKMRYKVKVGDAFQTTKGIAAVEAIVIGLDHHSGFHVEGEVILAYESGRRTVQLASRFMNRVANGAYVRLKKA